MSRSAEKSDPPVALRRIGHERVATALIVVFSLCYCAYTAHTIFHSAPEYRVQFVPDDAYYYMALARNFAQHGQWSFDSGVSLTSGFHPLHAYVLAAIYSLTHPQPEQFVGFAVILSFALAMLALLALGVFAIRTGRLAPGLVLLLFVLSRNASLNVTSAVEWGWVVCLSVCYYLAFWHLDSDRRKTAIAGVVVFGFLGSLARTDFGLLPAALAVASLPTARTRQGGIRFYGAVAGLIAASFGVAVDLVHNHVATGQYLQSSARMKGLWLLTYGPAIRPIVVKTLGLFGNERIRWKLLPVGLLTVGTVILGLRCFLGAWLSRDDAHDIRPAGSTMPRMATLWFGSLITIAGYMVFYSLNSGGTQHWYTAGLMVPIFLAVNMPLIHMRPNHPVSMGALVVLIGLVAMQVPYARDFRSQPEWPHQRAMFRGGHFLAQARPDGTVGSWNAGIIGYYEGGHVVNLDGLVNNDIYPYAKGDGLLRYIEERNIRYIIDFPAMFTDEKLRIRGGYGSSALQKRLSVIRTFAGPSSVWGDLTLYEVQGETADLPEPALPADEQPPGG